MAIEPSISPQPPVRPVNDAERGRPDARPKPDGKKRRREDERHEEGGPTRNERGEVTGKVINITA